jgi:hypothetical protein
MDMKVLRLRTRTFCFLPRRAVAQDDSGATEGARARGEAGATVEGPVGSATCGGGGTVGPRIM